MTCGCPRDRLCAVCYGGLYDNLRGTAATRGEVWADDIAKRVDRRQPWPPYNERVAAIALRKVADLTPDPRLQAVLAAELAGWAARRWAAITTPPLGNHANS